WFSCRLRQAVEASVRRGTGTAGDGRHPSGSARRAGFQGAHRCRTFSLSRGRSMTTEDVEARIARLRDAPRHVKAANTWATLVGLATLLRACASAYAGHLTYGKALLFGCLLLVWFSYCGFSLLNRSRWGFVTLVVLAALPLFGVFAAAVHLLRLLEE